jgi:hypothetical protein
LIEAPDVSSSGLSWSNGSWIYYYLCNQCVSPPKLWVGIPLMARCTRYNIMWSVTFGGFLRVLRFPPPIKWLQVTLNTITITPNPDVSSFIHTWLFLHLLLPNTDHLQVKIMSEVSHDNWKRLNLFTRLTWRVPLVEQELLTLPEHLSSPSVFSGVRVTHSLVLLYGLWIIVCPFVLFLWPLCCLSFDLWILITPFGVI